MGDTITPAGERSHRASGLAFGYPVHRVADEDVTEWDPPNGLHLTKWTAACGATDTEVGRRYGRDEQPRGSAMSARRGELCKACWPSLSTARR